MRLLDVELNFGSSEEQGDSDSEEGADDDGDGSLVDLLETRLRQDGVDLEEARGIAEQVVQIRTQRDEWESVRANIEAADAAYDEILSEFAERKRKIVESGVDSPGNPLAVFILDFLYWPHDKVSRDVGYLDTSILTYRNLGQYGFFDTLRSGQSTVMQTHLCQARSSAARSPTHPRNGVFSCDQAVQELCRWFSRTVYQTRLNLRVPGFIFGYGAYNTNISGAEAGSQPFSFEWDVDHPSSYAYAGTHGGMRGALKGLSYALTLDRALEERVLLAGLPQVAQKKFSFQRKARANDRTRLLGHWIAYSLDAEWDQKVNHAYRAKLQRRGRLALVDSDEAVARDSFSLSKLAIMLDDIRLAAGTEGEAK